MARPTNHETGGWGREESQYREVDSYFPKRGLSSEQKYIGDGVRCQKRYSEKEGSDHAVQVRDYRKDTNHIQGTHHIKGPIHRITDRRQREKTRRELKKKERKGRKNLRTFANANEGQVTRNTVLRGDGGGRINDSKGRIL